MRQAFEGIPATSIQTTEEEIDYTVKLMHEKIGKLREMSPLWDMYKEGIDVSKIEWAHH